MKHHDGTIIAYGTPPNEAMWATKDGLHGGFATLRFLANRTTSFSHIVLSVSLGGIVSIAVWISRGPLPPR